MANDVDALTGLAGRGALREALGFLMEAGDILSLATLDLDRFMEINLDFGPQAGDKVLMEVARLLEDEASRQKGTAFRLSGDEFGLLLPGATLETAFLQMEAVRKQVESGAERFALPDKRTVTVTIGVAEYPRDGKNVSALLNAAEAALASAKEQGRNAVALPLTEEMVMKSCYYSAVSARKLKSLAERLKRKESVLLREALTDLIAKYDTGPSR